MELTDAAKHAITRWPTRGVQTNVDQMEIGLANLPKVLASLGFKDLREPQRPVIYRILSGRDVIAILPTSMGKSLCFIAPTLCLGWRTLVFSPLVALMADQLQGLWAKNVKAAQMSGMQSEAENADALRSWIRKDLNFMYVAPERLGNPQFRKAIRDAPPDMVVVDETHCLSDWSDNFRSEYCSIGDLIADVDPQVVAAFTATGPPKVIEDTKRVLCVNNAKVIINYPRRKNLKLASEQFMGDEQIAQAVARTKGSCLIYCSTRGRTEDLACTLQNHPLLYKEKLAIGYFHGDMDRTPDNPNEKRADKRVAMGKFMSGETRIMVATIAFGMGIDKADIRAVFHRDVSKSIEAVSQEVGRAGRDGLESECRMFFDERSVETQKMFIRNGYPEKAMVSGIYNTMKRVADKDGIVMVTQADLSTLAGYHPASTQATFQLLLANAVVEHVSEVKKFAVVGITEAWEEANDAKLTDMVELIKSGSDHLGGGRYAVSLEWLAGQLLVTETTVRKRLKDYEFKKLLAFEPPFRGKPTRVVGSLSRIDFDVQAHNRERAYERLNDVIEYATAIPDDEKHSFIEYKLGIPKECIFL